MRRTAGILWLTVLVGVLLSGCGAVSHEATLLNKYVPEPGSRIEIGRATNATGQVPKVDGEVVNVEQLLTDALAENRLRLAHHFYGRRRRCRLRAPEQDSEVNSNGAMPPRRPARAHRPHRSRDDAAE